MSDVSSLSASLGAGSRATVSSSAPADSAPRTQPGRADAAPGRLEESRSDLRSDTTVGDRVEVSPVAQYLARLREEPGIRTDVVERVKAEIESGAYDQGAQFEAKLDSALDALVDDLYG